MKCPRISLTAIFEAAVVTFEQLIELRSASNQREKVARWDLGTFGGEDCS